MRFTNPKFLAVFIALPLLARSFSITETTSGATVAAAIFDGPGLNVLNVISLGESSMGTFADGPFGLRSGGILTSGKATGAYTSGDRNVDNGVAGCAYVCAPNTQNVNALQVQVELEPGYNGVRIEFVFATQEAPSTLANMDAISILDVTNGPPVQYALDTNANQINALSPFLLTPDAIAPPDSLTGYTRSSPPLINYVHTTSTLPPGEQPFTSTVPASGTESGTFIVFVEPTGVTTTTGDATTTADETTTTGETTTTTDEFTTTTTAEPTTATTDESTTTTDEVAMTTTTEPTITTADDPTTTTVEVTTTTEVFTTTAETITTETTTTAIDELTTTELVSTNEQTTSLSFESTTTMADVTSESVSTTQETTIKEWSTTIISSEMETLTTDEVSSSTDESTTSTPAESQTSSDASPILSTTSEAASTSVDQRPVLVSDTTSSESIVPTTDALAESTASITSESSSVAAAVSSESTASSIVSTGLPPPSSSESTSFEEETLTSTSEIVPETTFTPVEPVTSTTSTPANGPSNIDTIRGYTYKGCLGSADGYPSFSPIGSGANMTTSSCVALARSRAYVGIYDRSCYASDSLDSTSLVLNGRCDIPCPGDSSHFCGGLVVSSSERRWVGPRKALDKRAAPANILLTLYALDDEPPAPGETSTEAEVPVTTQDGVTLIPTESASSRPVDTVTNTVTESLVLRPVETAIDSVAQPGQTLVETTVTTVTYTIVDPNNPSTMTVTEYYATLSYEPCIRCAHPPIPTVEMTTYVMPCKSCGYHGENRVTITAPCTAITEPARNDAHGSQDLVGDFAPTRAAYQAKPGPVRTVTTALRNAKTTAAAGSGHIESTSPNRHQPSDGENTYPSAGHAQPHAVSPQSSSGASGNGTAVPGVVVAEAKRYKQGILGYLTMVFIAMGVLL
ncbi:hypothetical protein FBULB1_2533 [Fusarium bulbicola]|nr:hypothetical protein FBULB1_2533 [Fusarium bulbicola]